MAVPTTVKKEPVQLVGVITTVAELEKALRLKRPPDLFEVRLDYFIENEEELENKISLLPAPLILTARHPAEGGAHKLSTRKRRDLLLRFLSCARYIDIELRSAEAMTVVLSIASSRKVRQIISLHDFTGMPTVRRLSTSARKAKRLGADVFKVAVRTDTHAQLARLHQFIENIDVDLRLSVMGVGKLGLLSRISLACAGSSLIYAAVNQPIRRGQPSLAELRSALASPTPRIPYVRKV